MSGTTTTVLGHYEAVDQIAEHLGGREHWMITPAGRPAVPMLPALALDGLNGVTVWLENAAGVLRTEHPNLILSLTPGLLATQNIAWVASIRKATNTYASVQERLQGHLQGAAQDVILLQDPTAEPEQMMARLWLDAVLRVDPHALDDTFTQPPTTPDR